MKNNIITILCLLLCNFSVKAQFGIGARVGFSMSTMIGVQGTKLVPNPGATTAVSGEFRLIDKQSMALYIQPEFALEQKGYASRNELSSFWSESHYNFDYLSLPVAAKIMFGGGKFKGGLVVGASPSLLIGRYAQYKDSDGDRLRTVINQSNVRSFDINAFVGGVMEYALGPGALFADLRYTQGFIDPYTSYNAKPDLGTKYLNASPSFSVGYVFRIGRKSVQPTSSTEVGTVPKKATNPTKIEEEVNTSDASETRPKEIDDSRLVEQQTTRRLEVAPQSSVQEGAKVAATTSDFAEMIAINKHLDVIADNEASTADKQVNMTEILAKFKSPDAPVVIEKNGVHVDYFGIANFLEYIKLNHYRYKVRDRVRDDSGLITELRVERL